MKKIKKLISPATQDWTTQKEALELAAHEQAQADIQLAEAAQALRSARVAHETAIARQAQAEKRLDSLRARLQTEGV